jgi:hypothetical protein
VSFERWVFANIIFCIVSCIIWAQYVGWLKASILGPLLYLLGWMMVTWFAL